MRPLGRYISAPPPRFGVPQANLPRFRSVTDRLGAQYDADYFVYTIFLNGEDVLPANGTIIENIPFDLDSVFEASLLTLSGSKSQGELVSAPAYTLQLVDQTSNRQLLSSPTWFGNIAGTADFAAVLPITRRFMPGTNLQAIITDFTGDNSVEVALSFHGRKLFTQGAPRANIPRFNTWVDQGSGAVLAEDLFWYTFDATLNGAATIDTGTSFTIPLRIEVESDFEWITSTCAALISEGDETQDGTGLPMQGCTVNIKDTSTGRYLSNEPVPIYQYFGGNQSDEDASWFAPLILPQPKIWAAGTQIDLEFTNNSGSTVSGLQLTMAGRKIFEQS